MRCEGTLAPHALPAGGENEGVMDGMASVTPSEFTGALRNVASTVAIISTADASGEWYGMTATAVTSVSAEPPQLLICTNRLTTCCGKITESRRFAVNYLAPHHNGLSRRFADPRATPRQRFAGGPWRAGAFGVPILSGALAAFSCRVVEWHDYGTHRVFIGAVGSVEAAHADPLLYVDGTFASVTPHLE